MRTLVFALAISLWTASAAVADVRLTMQDGRVSIVAKDATIRQILTEWARIGKTQIVNLERIPGGPVTLELTNVTEKQALDVLLRPLSGYMLVLRVADAANVSRFDRIVVIPTIAEQRPALSTSLPPPSGTRSPAPTAMYQPAPTVAERVEEHQDVDPAPAPEPMVAAAVMPNEAALQPLASRGSTLNRTGGALETVNPQTFLRGRGAGPGQPPAAARSASPFTGVAVPGMIAPAPQQGQPGRGPGEQ